MSANDRVFTCEQTDRFRRKAEELRQGDSGEWAIQRILIAFGCDSRPCPHVHNGGSKGKLILRIFTLAAVMLLAACESTVSSTLNPTLVAEHVICVNGDGLMQDLEVGGSEIVSNPNQAQDYLERTIFTGFKRSGKTKILVFVHGGLDDQKAGMSHFWDSYKDVMKGDYYPVYLVWPSGWASTYFEHLLWVRQGIKPETTAAKAYGLLTSPLVLIADVGRSLTRLPLVIANDSKSDLTTVVPVRRIDGGQAVEDFQELERAGFNMRIGDDYMLGRDRTLRFLSYSATLPIKYFGSSLIDGFGQGAWDDMLRRTITVYPESLDAIALGNIESTQGMAPNGGQLTGAGARPHATTEKEVKRTARFAAAGLPTFIMMLRRKDVPTTLVGHSMGTIIINRVVRNERMNFENIVYMGAACSMDDFATSVLIYMQYHPSANFYNLSLHPVAEAGEMGPFDMPPRGSLLIWIDNFLQKPNSESERALGAWQNLFLTGPTGVPMVSEFLDNKDRWGNALATRLHFRSFSAGDGDQSEIRGPGSQWNEKSIPLSVAQRAPNPVKHGDFASMPYWLSEFWWPSN